MKKLNICFLSILILLTGVFSSCEKKETTVEKEEKPAVQATEILLANNGTTDYKVVIPENAGECVEYAAEVLCEYFERSTGAVLAVETDAGKSFSENDKVISLGDTVLQADAGITVASDEVNLDGYKLIRRGNTVFVSAYEDRGVLYGAYEFLHYAFGYECYAIDEITLTENATAYLPDLNITDAPSFRGRMLDGPTDFNHELQSKMRLKNNQIGSRYGGGGEDASPFGTSHSFFGVVDYETNAKIHPEWFSNPSERNASQLCLTNAELIDYAAQQCIAMLESHPNALYVNISEEDFGAFCECDRAEESFCGMGCKESRLKYTGSGTLIRFLNEIIERVEAWRETNCPERDVRYMTFAYHADSMNAPVKRNGDGEIELIDSSCAPHEKLYIKYAPIGHCFYHDIADETCSVNNFYAQTLKNWIAVTDRFMVWDYRTCYSHYFAFFNNYNNLQNEYKRYKDMGVIDFVAQYVTGSNLASMSDLNVYLNSKLMWNVDADVNALTEAFMNEFYKDGAPYMKEYFNMIRTFQASVEAERKANGESFHILMYDDGDGDIASADIWPKSLLERSLELFDKAYTEYDKLADRELAYRLKQRVLKESICVRYIMLYNYASYYNIYSSDYRKAIDIFEADLRDLSIPLYRENYGVGGLIEILRGRG